MREDREIIAETESGVPTNSMGASSSSSGPIQTFDPLLIARPIKRKKLSDIVKIKKLSRVK
jgi:hypothetical protein